MSGDATRRAAAKTAIAVGALIRLAIAVSQPGIADVPNFYRVANTLRSGGTLYVDTKGLFPYPPVWSQVEVAALALAEKTETPFELWVKVPSILADVGISIVLWLLAPGARGAWLAMAYALNPVAILISGAHGQFDALAILACLGALLFTVRRPHAVVAGLCLGVGIALKSFPILLLPVFWPFVAPPQRRRFAAAAVLPAGLLLATYLLFVPAAVIREVFGYSGASDHGWAAAVRAVRALQTGVPFIDLAPALGAAKLLFLAIYALAIGRWLRRPAPPEQLPERIALVFVSFYVLYGGIGSQYLLWAVPFLLLVSLPLGLLYSVAATCSLVPFYRLFYSRILFEDPPLRPAELHRRFFHWLVGTAIWWLFCVGWLVRAARTPRNRTAGATDTVADSA